MKGKKEMKRKEKRNRAEKENVKGNCKKEVVVRGPSEVPRVRVRYVPGRSSKRKPQRATVTFCIQSWGSNNQTKKKKEKKRKSPIESMSAN